MRHSDESQQGKNARAAISGLATYLLLSAGAWAQDIRLAQNSSPISGVTMVAQANGYFEDHGLNVEILGFTSGRAALEAVIGGGAQIATTAEAPTTAAAMAKTPIAFLAQNPVFRSENTNSQRVRH